MKKNKIKICVIGAGPNGLASVIPFLDNLEKFEVTMISSGSSLFTDDILNMQNYLKSLNRDQQHKLSHENLVYEQYKWDGRNINYSAPTCPGHSF